MSTFHNVALGFAHVNRLLLRGHCDRVNGIFPGYTGLVQKNLANRCHEGLPAGVYYLRSDKRPLEISPLYSLAMKEVHHVSEMVSSSIPPATSETI